MGKFKVISQDNYEMPIPRDYDTKDEVDREGYRDVETLVVEMVQAGERLNDYRRGRFQFDSDSDDAYSMDIDPTKARDFDPADMTILASKAGETFHIAMKELNDLKQKEEDKRKKDELDKAVAEKLAADKAEENGST